MIYAWIVYSLIAAARMYNGRRRESFMKRPMLSALLTGAALLLLVLTAAGCAGRGEHPAALEPDGSLQKMLDAGRLVIGLDPAYPPMGFADESGAFAGFDIDMAQAVCERLGVELVMQPISWETKEETLNSGEIDCIWNGMSITPARAESMNLSDPYIQNELIFLVPRSSKAREPDDLAGGRVGAQPGSTTQEVLEASELSASISIVLDDDLQALMDNLQNGELDAVLIDSLFAYYYISMNDAHFYVLSDSLSEEECAIGFRKGDQTLRDAVQKTINDIAADGTLGNISKKWFGCDITIVR